VRRAAGVALLWLTAAAAEAGPWATGPGHFYAKLSYQHLRTTTLAAPDGTRFTIPAFSKDELGIYAAIGLSDRCTLIANLPVLRSSNLHDQPDELPRETGVGDLQAGLQAQIGQHGPWVFALRGMLQAPTGDETRAEGLLPTGSGVWEAEAWIGAGRSLAGGKGYGFLEAGYGARGGGLRDALVYAAQIGWNANSRLTLAANFRGVEPWSQRAGDRSAGSFVGVGDRVTYASYGPSAIVKLGRGLGVQLDLDGAFHARNLAEGSVLRVGVFLNR
jgi:hypothetical protein